MTLLLRKGIYPYEYMDGWSRFDEGSLLQKEAFYSKLYVKGITDDHYAHGRKVWDTFGCKPSATTTTSNFGLMFSSPTSSRTSENCASSNTS